MSHRNQRSSRHLSGRRSGKVHHKKTAKKDRKHRSGVRYMLKENATPSFEEVAKKTINRLNNLGIQSFAFSPFSQYFADWLLSLKSILSEFESKSNANIDEEFIKTRSYLIANIELKLSEKQREEALIEKAAGKLAKKHSLLIQTDNEYSYAIQELTSERKSELKRLKHSIRAFEEDLSEINQAEVGVFNLLAKRSNSMKKTKLNQKLNLAKDERSSIENEIEGKKEKLRKDYEEKKRAINEEILSLEEISSSEKDTSAEHRRVVCEELKKSVKALLERKKKLQ